MTDQDLLLALNANPRLDRETICRLAFPEVLSELWELAERAADPATARRFGVSVAQLDLALDLVPWVLERADRDRHRAERAGASILTRLDEGYPRSLTDLELPPPVLYVRGELPPERPGLSIVGSRRADVYGRQAAELMGRELAAAGLVVVSGFARGVDAAAHRGALEATAGRTVAVLGSGIDVDYPRGHRKLGEAIAEGGAVVSEFPFGAQPRPWHFPVRNRIIAALGVGTLVVQATPRSGSLITARCALELGREVYAIPGSIFERRASGPNALIRDGAVAVLRPRDVLESLPLDLQRQLEEGPAAPHGVQLPSSVSDAAGQVLGVLPTGRGLTPESVAGTTGLTIGAVQAALVELELTGALERLPGPLYSRRG